MTASLAVAILAAGKGTRMKSDLPKVLFEICGKPALFYPVHAASRLDPNPLVVVVGFGADQVKDAFADYSIASGQPIEFVLQKELLGTGHALQQTRDSLKGFTGDLLVLYGDGPLIRKETLERVLAVHREQGNQATVLTAVQDNPFGYGRIVRHPDGSLDRIVEEKDADEEIRQIKETNTGITVYRCPELFEHLDLLKADNEQQEYYLTDLPRIYLDQGLKVGLLCHPDASELDGYNSLAQYAALRKRVQANIHLSHMDEGVVIIDPDTTYIDFDVQIGPGTRILPSTVIQGPTRIGKNCSIGPFSFIRTGTELADKVGVGSFVEVKNSSLGEGSLSRHLSYIGDAQVGREVNVGAGTITANYDGRDKHRTVIHDRAFIGSGAVIIAPAEIGEGCTIGAGAVVKRNSCTEADSVYVGVPARKLGGGE